ncbi:MAG: hypothetical protein AB1489_43485 [Acidobacteriota bacterium]
MKKELKIGLGIGCGVVLIGVIAVTIFVIWGAKKLGDSLSEDPKKVENIAKEISDFELPQGYEGKFSFNLGFKMVMFIKPSSTQTINQSDQIEKTTEEATDTSQEPLDESNGKDSHKHTGKEINGTLIMLMSFPRSLFKNNEDMKKQVDESLKQQGITNGKGNIVDTKSITIRGKQTTLIRSVVHNEKNNRDMEQLFAFFEGKSDPAIFMGIGPKGNLDEEGITSFINSMK